MGVPPPARPRARDKEPAAHRRAPRARMRAYALRVCVRVQARRVCACVRDAAMRGAV